MIVMLGEDWRINSDPLNWILEKRRPNGKRWDAVAYFQRLDGLCVCAAERIIRSKGGVYNPETLDGFCRAVAGVETLIIEALEGIPLCRQDWEDAA